MRDFGKSTCIKAIEMSWLVNSVTLNLISGIIYDYIAHAVWEDLRERFDKLSCSRSFNLHREIVTQTQGTSSISAYCSKLKDMWDKFEALVPLLGCNCVISKDYVVYLHKHKLYQLFMGLNEY